MEISGESKPDFLMRLPSVIAPPLRFVLDGIDTSLFSIESLYSRVVASLSNYDSQSLFSLDRQTRSNIFSDVWGIVDYAYMASQLLAAFLGLDSPEENDRIKTTKTVQIGDELATGIEGYLGRYQTDVSCLRNMMDHLSNNIKRVSSSSQASPIQGGLSYVLCSREDYQNKKAFIVMLTNNALTQETFDIPAQVPVGKTLVLPIDQIALSALNNKMKNTLLDISELYRDSAKLRKFLNTQLEEASLPMLQELAKEKSIPYEKLIESKAHSLTSVITLSFGINE